MKQKSSNIDRILTKFLLNQAERDEVDILERWIDESPEHSKQFLEFQKLWATIEIDHALSDDVLKADWDKVISKSGIDSSIPVEKKTSRFNLKWVSRIAAVFILGFTLAWGLFQGVFDPTVENQAFNEISTPRGSSSKILLPDGSKVWLNAGSKIKYPQNFKGKNKQIFLEGEAYFEVESDRRNSFSVVTDEITVQVHGTIFNVRSYPEDPLVETTLVEGEVTVFKHLDKKNKKSEPILLKPKQRIVLYKSEVKTQETEQKADSVVIPKIMKRTKARLVLAKNVDTQRFTSWKDGQLIIKSESMDKLSIQLERRYNVRIHFVNEDIRQVRYSGTIEDETIEQVLAAMELASPISYRIKDRDIWIDLAQQNNM